MAMVNFVFIPSFVISFVVTLVLTPAWIKYAKKINLVGKDMHKINSAPIPEAGGIVVIASIFAGLFYYAVVLVGYSRETHNLALILGIASSLLMVAIIGVMDDLRGWKVGLKQWQKPLLTLPAAIPFVLVQLSRSTIEIPFLGMREVGLLFPLLFVPLAIVGASNAFNMLAGYNGLEAGMGLIILSVLGILSYLNNQYFALVLCLIGVFALFPFLIYNWYPSEIFPGDTMTYSIGAYIAIVAILGGVEKYGLLLFIPYFLDFFLPLRKGMRVEAFAKVKPDGSFELPYEGIYDTTHLVIVLLQKFKKKVYEKDVVLTILSLEVVISLICILIAVGES